MRTPNLALLGENSVVQNSSQTWSVTCQQKQASFQTLATSVSWQTSWKTHWRSWITVCSLQAKKMQGELQQSHNGMKRANDSCCWPKSKCLRLFWRSCELLQVSLFPSQGLQQLDVMWILHMENMLAQMVLPACKCKQLNEVLCSFMQRTFVLQMHCVSMCGGMQRCRSNPKSRLHFTSHIFW